MNFRLTRNALTTKKKKILSIFTKLFRTPTQRYNASCRLCSNCIYTLSLIEYLCADLEATYFILLFQNFYFLTTFFKSTIDASLFGSSPVVTYLNNRQKIALQNILSKWVKNFEIKNNLSKASSAYSTYNPTLIIVSTSDISLIVQAPNYARFE
ncbi:hypothetical protein RFI_15258 [Reticulomyxa filosa]|uniref:Uncharacterized protein n=1 Tax=Reticulomyxa filosa TaxID=46433 RepID=X6N6Q5_RETFI|nr:hypothetical protein RFI_15258 [Reticulomyxa filosa]|eukprot:ETO21945.1 hypothetical protein RFI_15258 [Reticulomyxa filosa]